MLGSGVLLFVSAHWNMLSPGGRFVLVLLLVASFHAAAVATADRSRALATTLHAVGTAALGAGIFLGGQVFNLDEHWPTGLMLWTLGAACAWALLREWPQMAWTAILLPAWLLAEWAVAIDENLYFSLESARVAACGSFLLAVTYFTGVRSERPSLHRDVLVWIGGISLIPSSLFLAAVSYDSAARTLPPVPMGLLTIGWTVAIGLPLIVAIGLRQRAAWTSVLAILWVLALVGLRPIVGKLFVYPWWATGAAALAYWGVREARTERVNMGSAIFAGTVFTFYFSQVMDKLGRSASLAGLGLLFLAGGWMLERLRRHLVFQARGGQA